MLGAEEWLVIRVVAVFALVTGMAYLLTRPIARRIQARLGFAQLVVAGLPFVALGMIARAPAVNVLSDDLLSRLSPFLALALTVVGLRLGLRVDVPHLLATPRAVATLAVSRFALGGSLVFLAVVAGSEGIAGFQDPAVVRRAAVLAIAGTVTSIAITRGLSGLRATEDIPLTERAVRLGELIAIGGLLVLGAYVRPGDGAVERVTALPPELWLLTAVGLAAVLGILMFQLLRDPAAQGDDAPVLAIGAVAVVAGVASYLGFSPLAIGALVGIVLGQLAGAGRDALEAAFDRYQRAVYGVLLFVLGALALPLTGHAFVVAALFVIVRLVSTVAATRLGLLLGRTSVDREAWRRLIVAPLGATSLAIVIAAHELDRAIDIGPVALALILAALVTELVWHVAPEEATR